MGWQEKLRRIDNDLAAGKLSKEQYAVKREEVLAEASSDLPPDTAVKQRPPVPAKDLLTTDRPTTAPSPADQRSTDSMPHPPVRPQPARPPAPIAQHELPPPVPKRPAAPPSVPPQRPAAPMAVPQGPVATKDHNRSGLSTWLFLAVGTIIAVGLIGGGLWWLTSANDGDDPAAKPPASAPPTSTTKAPTATGKPELIDRLPELPGVLNRNSGTMSVARGAKLKLYGVDEAQVLRNQNVRQVTWKGSSRGAGETATAYVILVAKNADESAAAATADALRKLGESRVKPTEPLDGHARLSTFKQVSAKSTTYRVIYTSGGNTVRVGIVQTPGTDEKRVVEELSELLTQVTAELPPNEG